VTVYRIADVLFDSDACEITVGGKTEHLQPQVREVLLSLVRHEGEVVSRGVLAEEAWHGRQTSDESLTRCISLLRRQLERGGQHQFIETIPKVGYRFHGPISIQGNPRVANEHLVPIADTHDLAPKTAVNLVITMAVLVLLLSGLVVAADFFMLNP
jgi:DNA-binding winged helix-turn-helix (wHTH) protein